MAHRNAADVAQSRFGAATVPKHSDVTVGTTAVPIAKNNPKRIQLSITNWGQGPIAFSSETEVTASTGEPVSPNGGNAILLVAEDGETVAWAYYAISLTAGNAVHITETELV